MQVTRIKRFFEDSESEKNVEIRDTVGGIEYRTLHIFLFSDPSLGWNIWFEAPSLLPAKWQCQNSPSEGNFIEKCLISEHFIIPSLEEKSSIFS